MEEQSFRLNSVPLYTGLTRTGVIGILDRISRLKAGVIGDSCLDLYWHADMSMSELSRETPHHNWPVSRETFVPGAAGNVASNFRELGCEEVSICSILGDDWRGMLLKDCFRRKGINDEYTISESERVTPAYCKTILHGLQGVEQEAPRIDFINFESPHEPVQLRLLAELDRMAAKVDVIGVVDQLKTGVIGPLLRDRLHYWAEQGKRIVVDSRDSIGSFRGVIVKPNEIEALKWRYGTPNNRLPEESEIVEAGMRLAEAVEAPCCVTIGDKGALWCENGAVTYVPTKPVPPPIDIVGAGDSFSAAFVSALGAGCPGYEAAAFAHLAAAVSVRQLGGVGTASPQQILDRFDEIA